MMSHEKASEVCKRMGMNLARIKTELEFKYLKEYIHQEYGPLGIFWLDGYKKNGEWIWKGRGEKIEKFFWHQGEPNNKSGKENCLNTWDYDFDWNDNDCEKSFYFICDIEA
ncbi:hypothetical protein DOY81_012329 [Sarcophaga bullata]|nr:hypothetical protein DOY81_012329 [Sarcophaga bullata]